MQREAASTSFFFLATLFCVTFEKVHWNVAGHGRASPTSSRSCFLLAFSLEPRRPRDARVPRTALVAARLLRARSCSSTWSASSTSRRTQALAQFAKGMVKFVIHFLFLARRRRVRSRGAASASTGGRSAGSSAGWSRTRPTASSSSLAARPGGNLDATLLSAAHRRRELDQHLRRGRTGRASTARTRSPATRTTSGSCSIVPLLVLTPIYLRLERGHRLADAGSRSLLAFLLARRARDALAQRRCSGSSSALLVLALPYRRYALLARAARAARRRRARRRLRRDRAAGHYFEVVLRSRIADRRRLDLARTSASTTSSRRSCTRTRCSGSG